MTPEQLLLAGLTTVSSCLCFLFKIIWERSKQCEAWRDAKEPLITKMAQALGIAEGTAGMVNRCDVPLCPFRGKLETSFSAEEPKTKNKL